MALLASVTFIPVAEQAQNNVLVMRKVIGPKQEPLGTSPAPASTPTPAPPQVTCSVPVQGKASGGPTVPGGSLGPVSSATEAAEKCTAFGRLNEYNEGICIYWKGNAYYNSGQLINHKDFAGSICSI